MVCQQCANHSAVPTRFPTVNINSRINGQAFYTIILVSGLLTADKVTCQCVKLEKDFLKFKENLLVELSGWA